MTLCFLKISPKTCLFIVKRVIGIFNSHTCHLFLNFHNCVNVRGNNRQNYSVILTYVIAIQVYAQLLLVCNIFVTFFVTHIIGIVNK